MVHGHFGPRVLAWVKGYKIPFVAHPIQATTFSPRNFSERELQVLDVLIPQLLEKGVIVPCAPEKDQFVSSIFLEPKPNGSFRLILNLKKLNAFLLPDYFKLEDSRTASRLVSPGCFMAKLDLKDAYYTVPVVPEYRKFLRFYFRDNLFEFTCLPFGLCSAPYVFTKLLRPVVSSLRQRGLISVVYLDDFFLIGDSLEECTYNVEVTCKLLAELGFIFSAEKCIFPPANQCQFLEFVFDSIRMTLSLPDKKRVALKALISQMRKKSLCSIRSFARFLGSLEACCPAIPYGWAYTKQFERDKFLALAQSANNFDAPMRLESRTLEFDWWTNNLDRAHMPLRAAPYVREIFSDASLSGWGACWGSLTAQGA